MEGKREKNSNYMTCAAKCREIFSSFLLNIITGFKFVKLKHCDRLMFWAVATQQ